MYYTLSKKDKETLKNWGYSPLGDLKQIEEAINLCVYTNTKGRQIKYTTAIRTLGKVGFLSGIARASFHWSASRTCGNKDVHFNCSSMFK